MGYGQVDPEAVIAGAPLALGSVAPIELVAAAHDHLWEVLARRGVRPDEPSTWPVGHTAKLQPFAKGGPCRELTEALAPWCEAIVGPHRSQAIPLVRFPDHRVGIDPPSPWTLPRKVWHLDLPGRGDPHGMHTARLFVLLAPVSATGGPTMVVEGSGALVRRLVAEGKGDAGSSAQVRKALARRHEWFGSLFDPSSDRSDPRFADGEDVDGVRCRVRAIDGAAGDVWAMDQWSLHAPSDNRDDRPRLAMAIFSTAEPSVS